jgi:F-type H+-transporting ATPase subunit b
LARREAQEILTRAKEDIAMERDKAQVTLRNDVVALAMGIAGKVVQEELTAEKHRKLVDAFLTEVEATR